MQILVNSDSHIEHSPTLTQEVETVVQHALGRFADRITRVAVYLSDENGREKFGEDDKRCAIEARLGGLKPVIVSHQGSSLDQAVSGAAGKLEKTLERTLGRKTSILMRNLGKRAELTAASPLLEHEAAAGKREDFTELLRPLLSHLAEHARRELRIMEASGAAHAGQHTVDDLLDELVTRAWIQFADRPRSMAFDLWLARILDEILEEQIHRRGGKKLSLDERSHQATPSDVPQVDDQEWWIWLLGEDEVTTPAEGLVGRQSAWAEKFLEAEELIHRIDFLLGSVPKLERQAFVLNVLEGYELYEIAMIQDRPESAILADVQAARDYLREQLGASGRSAGNAASPVSLVANQ